MLFSGIPHLTIFFHICPYAQYGHIWPNMPIMFSPTTGPARDRSPLRSSSGSSPDPSTVRSQILPSHSPDPRAASPITSPTRKVSLPPPTLTSPSASHPSHSRTWTWKVSTSTTVTRNLTQQKPPRPTEAPRPFSC